MQTYEIETLPLVKFAHTYHADTYFNSPPKRENTMEITFIAEGSITIEYDNEEYVADRGDIVCLMYDRPGISIKAYSYHEHRTVYAQLEWTRNDDPNGLYLPVVTPARFHTKAAESIIEQLIHNQLLFKTSRSKGAARFLDLLYEIDRCNRKQTGMSLPGEMLYAQLAREYVQDNIHSPVTQKSVAKYLGITPEYLCYVFKKAQGIPFQKYVNHEKLEAIKNLMEKEPVRLYEAAAIFGYSDPNYVSRLFKKYYGVNITDKQNQHPTIPQ